MMNFFFKRWRGAIESFYVRIVMEFVFWKWSFRGQRCIWGGDCEGRKTRSRDHRRVRMWDGHLMTMLPSSVSGCGLEDRWEGTDVGYLLEVESLLTGYRGALEGGIGDDAQVSDSGTKLVYVCLRGHHKIPPIGYLKRQESILSQYWRRKFPKSWCLQLYFFWRPFLGLYVAAVFLLWPHVVLSLCVYIPGA